MSSHADTIRRHIDATTDRTYGRSQLAIDAANALDALEAEVERLKGHKITLMRRLAKSRAENQRLRECLTWISDPSYVGNYSDAEVVEIHRSWAREALAGDEE